MIRYIFILAGLCCLIATPTRAQEVIYPDTLNGKRLTWTIASEVTFFTVGTLYLSEIWYRDHEPVPFHFYNDLAGWQQVDKFGHMYASYLESILGYKALRKSGVPKKKALIWGGGLGILLQTPIEIFDGLYEDYGFSPTDMVANTLGSLLVIGQELIWDDQRVKMKFSYSPSTYTQYRPGYFGSTELEKLATDYNGHTYWLSFNHDLITPKNWNLPPWLNLAVGYGANGMLYEFENPPYYRGQPLPEFRRYRQFYLSPDIDLSKIKTRSKFLRTVLSSLNILKVPAPTLEYNSEQGLKVHLLFY
ncbi:MAG: DUF2279 domain-containing protein [Cyclobacteriaceae bacterium]